LVVLSVFLLFIRLFRGICEVGFLVVQVGNYLLCEVVWLWNANWMRLPLELVAILHLITVICGGEGARRLSREAASLWWLFGSIFRIDGNPIGENFVCVPI